MTSKKHKKSRKKHHTFAIILVIVSILMIASGVGLIIIDHNFYLTLIGEDTVEVDVNKKYLENGAISRVFDKQLDNVVITGDVDNTKLGEYHVNYSTKLLFFKRNRERKVIVRDLEKPTISLRGQKSMYLNLGEKYIEPGYVAKDNVDGNITKNVVVRTNLNNQKEGKYVVKYTISDASSNVNSAVRTVEVVKRKTAGQTSSLIDFSFEGPYSGAILQYDPNREYNYFNNTVFLGDSNVVFLYQHGRYISARQTWGKFNLNIAQINASTFTTYINNKVVNVNTALSTYKPKYLIVSVGVNAMMYLSKDRCVREAQQLIDNVKKNYPGTTLIFSAVLPVYQGTINSGINYTINQYNYAILELCYKNRINFIDFSERVKDKNGHANHSYFECTGKDNCGFHLNAAGRAYYVKYIKHLDLGRTL